MSKRVRLAALLVAGFVAAVGLVLLIGPVKVTDAQAGGIACGSVVAPDNEGPGADSPQGEVDIYDRLHGECTSRLGTQAAVAWPLLGVGLLGTVAAGLLLRRERMPA